MCAAATEFVYVAMMYWMYMYIAICVHNSCPPFLFAHLVSHAHTHTPTHAIRAIIIIILFNSYSSIARFEVVLFQTHTSIQHCFDLKSSSAQKQLTLLSLDYACLVFILILWLSHRLADFLMLLCFYIYVECVVVFRYSLEVYYIVFSDFPSAFWLWVFLCISQRKFAILRTLRHISIRKKRKNNRPPVRHLPSKPFWYHWKLLVFWNRVLRMDKEITATCSACLSIWNNLHMKLCFFISQIDVR